MTAVMVLPGEDSALWLARLSLYAAEHNILVVEVITVLDDDPTAAGRDLQRVMEAGEADEVLVAFREHLPPLWPVVVAGEADAHLPLQRRPHLVERGGPRR